ncbi:hypothetical protein VPH35_003433 [Triticum aestivum]
MLLQDLKRPTSNIETTTWTTISKQSVHNRGMDGDVQVCTDGLMRWVVCKSSTAYRVYSISTLYSKVGHRLRPTPRPQGGGGRARPSRRPGQPTQRTRRPSPPSRGARRPSLLPLRPEAERRRRRPTPPGHNLRDLPRPARLQEPQLGNRHASCTRLAISLPSTADDSGNNTG